MKENLSEIAVILDESGSMSSLRNDAIGGLNTFVEEQKKVDGEARFTLTKFNTNSEVIIDGKDLNDIKEFTSEDFCPNGGTALYDAVGSTINAIGKRLADMKEEDRPANVIVAILTDGEENSSQEFNKGHIKEMIEHQQEKYNWTFIFLAANQDAFLSGGSLGISSNHCFNYVATGVGVRYGYDSMSKFVTSARLGN